MRERERRQVESINRLTKQREGLGLNQHARADTEPSPRDESIGVVSVPRPPVLPDPATITNPSGREERRGRLPETVKMSALEAERVRTVARELDLASTPYALFVIEESGLIEGANHTAEQ